MDFRFIENVNVLLCLSEKQIAALGFMNLNEKLDYESFRMQEPAAMEWAKELYTYYWARSSDKIPEQLFIV